MWLLISGEGKARSALRDDRRRRYFCTSLVPIQLMKAEHYSIPNTSRLDVLQTCIIYDFQNPQIFNAELPDRLAVDGFP